MSARRLDAVLLALTATAASADALSYLGLDQVFPANMTGNTVLLAVGAAHGDLAGAVRSATALVGFVFGAAVGGTIGAAVRPGRERRALLVRGLVLELVVLIAAAAWWITIGDIGHGARLHGLIALLGTAMGLQSATVTQLDVGVSTTFITGTWTTISRIAGTRLRGHEPPPPDETGASRQVLVVACYLLAALGSGLVYRACGAWAAVIPPALIVGIGAGAVLDRSAARVQVAQPSDHSA